MATHTYTITPVTGSTSPTKGLKTDKVAVAAPAASVAPGDTLKFTWTATSAANKPTPSWASKTQYDGITVSGSATSTTTINTVEASTLFTETDTSGVSQLTVKNTTLLQTLLGLDTGNNNNVVVKAFYTMTFHQTGTNGVWTQDPEIDITIPCG